MSDALCTASASEPRVFVVGPIALTKITPGEIRGFLTTWFGVAMCLGLVAVVFCVYGLHLNMEPSRLRYQVSYIAPLIFIPSAL